MGFWDFGGEGWDGWRVGQLGSVYKQPETGEEGPDTAGGCQGECAVYICEWVVCVTEWLEDWIVLNIVYILIIIRMNVVDNLNSV